MAYEEALTTISLEASTDLSSYQYRVVKVNTSGQVALCGASDVPCGVLQNKPSAQGQAASVAIGGVTKLVAASGVAAGDRLGTGSNGIAGTYSSGPVLGIALEDAPDDGGIISAILTL